MNRMNGKRRTLSALTNCSSPVQSSGPSPSANAYRGVVDTFMVLQSDVNGLVYQRQGQLHPNRYCRQASQSCPCFLEREPNSHHSTDKGTEKFNEEGVWHDQIQNAFFLARKLIPALVGHKALAASAVLMPRLRSRCTASPGARPSVIASL